MLLSRQVVVLEPEQELTIPDNCWAFIETADGKKRLVVGTVKFSEATKVVLVPKVAGG